MRHHYVDWKYPSNKAYKSIQTYDWTDFEEVAALGARETVDFKKADDQLAPSSDMGKARAKLVSMLDLAMNPNRVERTQIMLIAKLDERYANDDTKMLSLHVQYHM